MSTKSELVDIKQSVVLTLRQLCELATYFDLPIQKPSSDMNLDLHITIANGVLPESVDEKGKEYAAEDALFAFGTDDELSEYGIVAL